MKRHSMWVLALMVSAIFLCEAPRVCVAQTLSGGGAGNFHGTLTSLPPEAQSIVRNQMAKLTESEGVSGDGFAYFVAMSGNAAVVTAFGGWQQGAPQGAAYVFVKPSTGWADMTPTATLTASDGGPGDLFGTAVAISGNTIVVIRGNGGALVAYVFVEPPTGWVDMTETAKLTAPYANAVGVYPAVAIDGSTIVIGDPNVDAWIGAAFVFVKPPGGWVSTNAFAAELTPPYCWDGNCIFGHSVSVSGNTVVVGSAGNASVYVRPPGGWNRHPTQAAVLSESNGYSLFSVAIAGNTIIAGCPDATVGPHIEAGELFLYVEPPTGWADMTETAKLAATDGAEDASLGYSVGINADATLVVAGAPGWASSTGALYLFSKPAAGWKNMSQTAEMTASDGVPGSYLGQSVAISGNVILGGAPAPYLGEPGSAYLFRN